MAPSLLIFAMCPVLFKSLHTFRDASVLQTCLRTPIIPQFLFRRLMFGLSCLSEQIANTPTIMVSKISIQLCISLFF
jgi:hypothetical protein